MRPEWIEKGEKSVLKISKLHFSVLMLFAVLGGAAIDIIGNPNHTLTSFLKAAAINAGWMLGFVVTIAVLHIRGRRG